MNTAFGQQTTTAAVPSENGAVTSIHSDKILILDAGAQYGKVSRILWISIKFYFKKY